MNPSLSVLIIDDNAKMRSMIAEIIKHKTSEIFECSDGLDALHEYDVHRPDWVVMDVKMKYTDGITATGLIHEYFPKAKIIIVSQENTKDIRQAAYKVGASAFVGKENLLSILDNLR